MRKQRYLSILRALSTLSALIILALGPRSAAADSTGTKTKTKTKKPPEPIAPERYESVVVGKRLPEAAAFAERSVSVISPQALTERAPRTVPEALLEAPGVFVQQTNHGGGSPIIRGMIGPQNLILIDGVRLNNSVYRTGPTQYLNLIDPLSISRIEVMRGPGSVLYGSDALGGVIRVESLAPGNYLAHTAPGAGGQALLRYASANDGKTAHLHLNTGLGGFSMLGGFTFKDLGDLSGGRSVGVQPYSGYTNWSTVAGVTQRLKWGPLHGWRVTARYLSARITDAGRTDKLFDKRSLQLYDNVDDLVYARLHFLARRLHTSGDLTLSYQHFFERKDNTTMGEDLRTPLKTVRDETTAHTVGLDLQAVTRLFSNRVRMQYGAMWYGDQVSARQLAQRAGARWSATAISAYADGSTYSSYGGFLRTEGDPWYTRAGGIVRLSAGYRLHGMSGAAPAQAQLDGVDFDHLGHVVQAGAQFIQPELGCVALTFSQGFRAPNLNEAVMLGDTGKLFHIPNHNLGPERSDTVELVLRGWVWRLTASVAGYVSLLHDLIKRVDASWEGQQEIGGKPVMWNENGGEGTLLGLETRLDLRVERGLTLSGHLTWTRGEEDLPDGAAPLTRIPPLFGQIKLRYETPHRRSWRGFFETSIRAAADQDRLSAEDLKDARIPAGGTPHWWTWNIAMGLELQEKLGLGLTLENLLDKRYKYHGSGLYAPGVNAVVTVDVHY
jgi:outer membrane receptor protein involved in Fe transport